MKLIKPQYKGFGLYFKTVGVINWFLAIVNIVLASYNLINGYHMNFIIYMLFSLFTSMWGFAYLNAADIDRLEKWVY